MVFEVYLLALISVTYASSPSSDLLIPTLEFNNETAGVIRLAQSFNDVTATTELSKSATFIESAWEVSLPNKDATGQQTLQFQICNVTGEAQRFIDDCLKSGKPTNVIYREFYASDLSAPASAPIKMTLRGGSAEGIVVGIEAGSHIPSTNYGIGHRFRLKHTSGGYQDLASILQFYVNNGTTNAARVQINNDGTVRATSDNSSALGTSAFRWSAVYAGTGTINTSDEREKTFCNVELSDVVLDVGDETLEQKDEGGNVMVEYSPAGIRYEEALALEAALMRRTTKRLEDKINLLSN